MFFCVLSNSSSNIIPIIAVFMTAFPHKRIVKKLVIRIFGQIIYYVF